MPESSVAWYRTNVVVLDSKIDGGVGPLVGEKEPELSLNTGSVQLTVPLSDPKSGSTVVFD